MAGVIKQAQARGFGSRGGVVTFGDVYDTIRRDMQLTLSERERVVSGVKALTGKPARSEPLATAFATTAGAAVGAVVANHFKLGPVGMAASTVFGAGLGNKLKNRGVFGGSV